MKLLTGILLVVIAVQVIYAGGESFGLTLVVLSGAVLAAIGVGFIVGAYEEGNQR